jgi:RNA polymerase sigma factor (sigma-70 family)
MGFEKTNRIINDRIQEISLKFKDDIITERERNELATLIYPKLRYHVWKFCKNNDDTDEALQWTLKKIFNNIPLFDFDKGRFTTWIYTIARNETLYYLHMKKRNKMYAYDGVEGEYASTHGESPEFETFEDFELEFKKMHDMTIDEIRHIDDTLLQSIAIDKMIKKDKVKCIADRYSINENTVKTKLRKIRADIKERVLEKNPEFRETLNHVFDI